MRFLNHIIALGLVALVAAQDATLANGGSTSAASSSPTLSAQARCLQQCGSADVCCQAACVNVPCPSQPQANATTAAASASGASAAMAASASASATGSSDNGANGLHIGKVGLGSMVLVIVGLAV